MFGCRSKNRISRQFIAMSQLADLDVTDANYGSGGKRKQLIWSHVQRSPCRRNLVMSPLSLGEGGLCKTGQKDALLNEVTELS